MLAFNGLFFCRAKNVHTDSHVLLSPPMVGSVSGYWTHLDKDTWLIFLRVPLDPVDGQPHTCAGTAVSDWVCMCICSQTTGCGNRFALGMPLCSQESEISGSYQIFQAGLRSWERIYRFIVLSIIHHRQLKALDFCSTWQLFQRFWYISRTVLVCSSFQTEVKGARVVCRFWDCWQWEQHHIYWVARSKRVTPLVWDSCKC